MRGIKNRLEKLEERINPKEEYTIIDLVFWDGTERMIFRNGKYAGGVSFDKSGRLKDFSSDVPREFLDPPSCPRGMKHPKKNLGE